MTTTNSYSSPCYHLYLMLQAVIVLAHTVKGILKTFYNTVKTIEYVHLCPVPSLYIWPP